MSNISAEDRANAYFLKKMSEETLKNPTISEAAFANRWVSMFLEREFGDREKVIVNAWVTEVSKNAGSPVDIVNTKGEVIITIPPIVGSTFVNIHKSGKESFSHIAHEAAALNQTIPGAGDNLLPNAAAKVLQLKNFNNSNDFWLALFMHFKVDMNTYLNTIKKPNEVIIGMPTMLTKTTEPVDMGNFDDD